VRFFQCFNSLVILFEFLKLFFEFLAAIVEAFLKIHYFDAHCFGFLLVGLFESICFFVDGVSVALESSLGLKAFGVVFLFELTDFFLPTGAVLRLFQSVFLLSNHGVGCNKHRLNFFFVSIVACSLCVEVLFVLGMQVEDHLRELGDLLAHLVVSLF
jgi:hypothetical protein